MSEPQPNPSGESGSAPTPATPPARRRAVDKPSWIVGLVIWLTKPAAFAFFVLLGFFLARELGFFGGTIGPEAEPGAGRPTRTQKIEDVSQVGTHRARLSLAKVKQGEAVDQAKATKQLVDQAIREATGFDNRAAELLTGEEGRAVATNRELVAQFIGVIERERTPRTELERMRTAVTELLKPLETSLNAALDASMPPEDLVAQVTKYEGQAKDANQAYRSAREQLEALVSQAKSGGAPGQLTLKAAAARLRLEEAQKESREIEESRANGRKEYVEKIKDAEADMAKLLAAKELQVKQTELAAELRRQEYERKKRLAENPAIQQEFAPLLTKGRWLFKMVDAIGPQAGHWSKLAVPVSVSALVKGGYLRNVETFALAMSGQTYTWVKDEYNHSSDRPRVKYPETPAEWQKMDELYKRFLELSPVWIDMGLLTK